MNESKKIHILIAAGGSGGHLLPARQLAHLLRKKKECGEILFMGGGLSKSAYFQQKEFSFYEVPSSSIRKKNPFRLFRSLCTLFYGTLKSLKKIRAEKIDIVVGFGSYHSFPVLLAAKILRLPIVLFEANCVLGKVNAFFAGKAKKLAAQFPLEKNYPSLLVERLPWITPPKVFSQNEARASLGLLPNLFTFLIFGGSQGATFINQLFLQTSQELQRLGHAFQIIHLAGSSAAEKELQEGYGKLKIKNYVRSFEKEMPKAFAAADLVICRSGASSIAELIFFEKPSVLIPFPHAAENHQEKNARFMTDIVGGGLLLKERQISLPLFADTLEKFFTDEKLFSEMRKRIATFKAEEQKRDNFADLICEIGGAK